MAIHTQVLDQYSVSADTPSLGIGISIGKGKRVSEHLYLIYHAALENTLIMCFMDSRP